MLKLSEITRKLRRTSNLDLDLLLQFCLFTFKRVGKSRPLIGPFHMLQSCDLNAGRSLAEMYRNCLDGGS